MHGVKSANYAINNCDLLILLGARVGDRAVTAISRLEGATVIHIDVDPAEIGKNLAATIPVVGDVKNILEQLLECVKNYDHYDWKQERFPCYPTSVEFLPNQSVTVNANMQKAVDTGNVDTFYGCFVEKLIMEDGRCVGLYARDAATGEYIKCNAAKGVICLLYTSDAADD